MFRAGLLFGGGRVICVAIHPLRTRDFTQHFHSTKATLWGGTISLSSRLFFGVGGILQAVSGSSTVRSANRLLRITTTTDTKQAEKSLLAAIEALPATHIQSEIISSYYWWDGGVANDHERRLSFSTEQSLDATLAKIGSAHNYDIPMIIAESLDAATSPYWKGVFSVNEEHAAKLANELVKGRLVACAQVASNGSVALKTTAKAKAAVEKIVDVSWVPIEGNKLYMDWLDEETRDAETCE